MWFSCVPRREKKQHGRRIGIPLPQRGVAIIPALQLRELRQWKFRYPRSCSSIPNVRVGKLADVSKPSSLISEPMLVTTTVYCLSIIAGSETLFSSYPYLVWWFYHRSSLRLLFKDFCDWVGVPFTESPVMDDNERQLDKQYRILNSVGTFYINFSPPPPYSFPISNPPTHLSTTSTTTTEKKGEGN